MWRNSFCGDCWTWNGSASVWKTSTFCTVIFNGYTEALRRLKSMIYGMNECDIMRYIHTSGGWWRQANPIAWDELQRRYEGKGYDIYSSIMEMDFASHNPQDCQHPFNSGRLFAYVLLMRSLQFWIIVLGVCYWWHPFNSGSLLLVCVIDDIPLILDHCSWCVLLMTSL
jgi:hypothetical protein